ncbi:MAG: C40 family peptidase [Eubacterium sp.]|nr:C40 family peptidase [Eubacterium sp.]MDE7312931.1 C40 family peptidase [Eubacterium sp.]
MGRLLYMGIHGSLLLVAIFCFRRFFSDQVPRRFLVCLWICAIVRLLFPIAVPVRWHLGNLWNREAPGRGRIDVSTVKDASDLVRLVLPDSGKATQGTGVAVAPSAGVKEVLFVVWLTVGVLLIVYIFIRHMRSLRLYRISLPVANEAADAWLRLHRGFRHVSLRRCEFIKSPLTYGIIRPVILLPAHICLNEEEFLCVMEHEWVHIRWWDVFVKYLLSITLCIYWFHPLVWMMAVLLGRDMEIACDEQAIKNLTEGYKKVYMLTLIRLAESCGKAAFWVNAGFARRPEIEERIWYMMKRKNYSWKAAALAAGMLCCIVTAFTVSAQETPKAASEEAWRSQADDAKMQPAAENAGEQGVPKDTGTQNGFEKQSVSGEQAAFEEQAVSGEQVAELAREYVGAPYQPGGTDLSSGVDSEGFVKAIYALAGIELPESIYELADGGDGILLSELCAGDIIIYKAADLDGALPHMAVYDGSGQVIHASNLRDGVKASGLHYREISMAVRALK